MSSRFVRPDTSQQLRWPSTLLICALLLSVFTLQAFRPSPTQAIGAGDVTFTAITPFAVQDSNGSCLGQGPRAMYLQVNVTNPAGGSAGTLTNLTATISAFTGALAVTQDAEESATRYIGTLADGATTQQYYYINYACQAGSNPPAISSTYTVSIADAIPSTVTSGSLSITSRSELSANAGGQVTSTTIGPGAVVGQIIPMTVVYDFGNAAASAVAMIQPAGNVNFDSGCFRLMSVDITAVINFSSGISAATDNQLYFPVVNGASSNGATVVYYFMMMCNGATTVANPFSDLTSGGQIKYTGNFGFCSSANAVCPTYAAATNPFVISKRVTSPANAILPTGGGLVTYEVSITNTSTLYAGAIDIITDTLPLGATFSAISGGSGVTVANSSSTPSAGASGALKFIGKPTTNCPAGVCDGSYKVAASSTLKLIYTVNLSGPNGIYVNTVSASTGKSPIGTAQAFVSIGTPTAVAMVSFNAQATASSIRVRWQTSAEESTLGYRIYRSTDGERSNAVLLTPELIAAHGPNIGYLWEDSAVDAGVVYSYWVAAIDSDSSADEYGPVTGQIAAVAEYRVFLPFTLR
jgi:uncharacterized repeat protein (TIGR01451 family)